MRNTSLDLRRALLLFGLVGMASTGFPCGDKLMVVSRGQRTTAGHNAPHRGAILLYAKPGGPVAAALAGADLFVVNGLGFEGWIAAQQALPVPAIDGSILDQMGGSGMGQTTLAIRRRSQPV